MQTLLQDKARAAYNPQVCKRYPDTCSPIDCGQLTTNVLHDAIVLTLGRRRTGHILKNNPYSALNQLVAPVHLIDCATLCYARGFQVAGAEYGNECYCGTAVSSAATKLPGGCTMPCTGGPDKCGGMFQMSTFDVNCTGPKPPWPPPPLPTYPFNNPSLSAHLPFYPHPPLFFFFFFFPFPSPVGDGLLTIQSRRKIHVYIASRSIANLRSFLLPSKSCFSSLGVPTTYF